MQIDKTLRDMISVRRPARSKTERRWIQKFLMPLGLEADRYGNLIKRIGDSPILWSAHTDTVHRSGGVQLIDIDSSGVIRLAKAERESNCLGADDTAGIWLMWHLIRAGKPGLYVFHRDEEIGGLGSSHIATYTPELLDGIGAAIAFDRRGDSEIITYQAGGRCCSDSFAQSLGDGLGGLKPSPDGVFTDTANYTDLIGECTNVAVGYRSEHSARESLDAVHLESLLESLLELDADALPIVRTPGEKDLDDSWLYGRKGGGGRYHYSQADFESDNMRRLQSIEYESSLESLDYTPDRYAESVFDLVREYPAEVADWLEENGIDSHYLGDEIALRIGGAILRRRIG